jgi:hypothetical protein
MIDEAVQAARVAQGNVARSTWVDRLARFGLVAKGLSYGLVGVLAAALAIWGGGKATSRQGALETLADESWGKAILVGMAFGFGAYAIWRLAQAIFDRADEGSGVTGLAKRAGYLGRAALYGALTVTTVTLLDGSERTTSETGKAREATARVLDWPAGRWLVALGGAILIGAGIFNAYRALTQKFEEKWRSGEMTRFERDWGPRLSSIGLLARFVVFSLIGFFLVKAAYQYDPEEAIGLDGALRKIVQASYGPVLLGVVAAGLLCYALFCFFEARYRRV